MTSILAVIASVALIILVLTALLNVLTFPRLKGTSSSLSQDLPSVSILIPARNEAAVITQTVQAVLRQNYPSFEVIILDDHSEDATGQLAHTAANGDSRLYVASGQSPPDGWLGKNWACQQLAQLATGDLLVFVDADVQWSDGALLSLVSLLHSSRADLLTVWPTQITESWAERLVVPLIMLVIVGYLPLPMVHYAPFPIFAAANGQCLCFRKSAYQRIGGHASVRDNIVEDVGLAREIKVHGLRLRMADGAGIICCRMYHNWAQVRDGFAKNILAGHGDSVPLLIVSTLFHWLCFVFPFVWLLLGWRDPLSEYPLWPLNLIALGVGLRALSAAFSRQRVLDALLMPISVLLMTMIAVRALWWRWRLGGVQWKGRVIH